MTRWLTRIPFALGVWLGSGAALSSAVTAQLPEFPTLGAEYISKSGGFQVSVSGQLDLEGMHVTRGWESTP